MPQTSVKGYNYFDLILGENNHEIEAVRSTNFINEKTHSFEKKVAVEEAKVDYLGELCKQKVDEKLAGFYNKDVDYKKLYEQLNTKGE